ncbi:MAG: formylglycine-generating enzyme family protein [Cyanobacteria bacterium J06626_18]
MKRRKFFQSTGWGSLGFILAAQSSALASTFPRIDNRPSLELETFDFSATTIDKAGVVRQRKTHTASFFSESLSATEQLAMVAIAPGKFWMGPSRLESRAQAYERPRHAVGLSSFFISKYPITQAQWAAVAALPKVRRELNSVPSHFQDSNRPVESISWLDAMEFCDRLSQQTGRQYQLPSEAQWEYACRAGTQTPFNTGATITSQLADYIGTYTYQAENSGTYRQATVPVGQFPPNAFGLYDMHGNVWEWCADSWHPTYRNAPMDGKAWVEAQRSPMRTIRGGSWLDAPVKIRSASRSGYLETGLNRTIGFRVSVV